MTRKNYHPLVNPIRERILILIEEKLLAGCSLEDIAEMCDLSVGHLSTLRNKKRGVNISLNTVLKIWFGLGGTLEALFSDHAYDNSESQKAQSIYLVNNINILSIHKQVLEFDEKVLETALKRRPISAKRMQQLEGLLASIREILLDIKSVLALYEKKLKEEVVVEKKQK